MTVFRRSPRVILTRRMTCPAPSSAELEHRLGRVVAAGPYEVQAWAEVRDWDSRRRVNIGTFAGVAGAKAACEQHAAARLRQERDDPGPVDVRIAPGRRR